MTLNFEEYNRTDSKLASLLVEGALYAPFSIRGQALDRAGEVFGIDDAEISDAINELRAEGRVREYPDDEVRITHGTAFDRPPASVVERLGSFITKIASPGGFDSEDAARQADEIRLRYADHI